MKHPNSVGWCCRFLGTLLLGVSLSWAAAKGPNGIYHFKNLSGATYVDGDRMGFPPEGMLAGALGQRIKIKNKRIRPNRNANEGIVRAIQKDPRLNSVFSFQLKSTPKFRRFRKSADGVYRAESRIPLAINFNLSTEHNGRNTASAWANYTAELDGNRLVISVRFQGKSGYYDGEDYDHSAQVKGGARLLAKRKATKGRDN